MYIYSETINIRTNGALFSYIRVIYSVYNEETIHQIKGVSCNNVTFHVHISISIALIKST